MAKVPCLPSISPSVQPSQQVIHCYGCGMIWTVPPGAAQFHCPGCLRLHGIDPNLTSGPPIKVYGIDPTKLQTVCANCKAILNIPHAFTSFKCPLCHWHFRLLMFDINSLSPPSSRTEEVLDESHKASIPLAMEQPSMRSIVSVKDNKRVREIEQYEDCFVLEFDPDESSGVSPRSDIQNDQGSDDTDIVLVAEQGKVACRDYPHPRHLCAKHPFKKTRHDVHCEMCYCYICDTPAPCKEWIVGSWFRHCDAFADVSFCRALRSQRRRTRYQL